jgi:putative Mg2+ transporter-C (MgtC) family protein
MTEDLGLVAWEAALMAATFILCGIIGVERQLRQKSAGLRTHVLVGLGACALTLVSAHGFAAVATPGTPFDPSRIAAQVVSGIGFLGAGVIFVNRDTVRGLTTAATVWLSAAIGVACGAGLPSVVVLCVLGHLLVIAVSRLVNHRLTTWGTRSVVTVRYEDAHGTLRDMMLLARAMGYRASLLSTAKDATGMVSVRMHFDGGPPLQDLAARLGDIPGVSTVGVRVQGVDS